MAVPSVTVAAAPHAGVPSAFRRSNFARLLSVQPATTAPSPARPALGEFTLVLAESWTPPGAHRMAPLGEIACATIFTDPPASLRVTTTAFPAGSMVKP